MTECVLVTGGAGYIGSHTCKALAAAGYTPVTLDNLEAGHRAAVQWGPLEVGDLADEQFVASVFAKYPISAVMHFAAYAIVPESVLYPEKYHKNNVLNSLALLDAMHVASVNTIVFSSTCATYGDPQFLPITEGHPQKPVNPYGESKLIIEKELRKLSEQQGLHVAALRYFNAAGADPDGENGEQRELESHLVPLAIEAALGQRPELAVFGTDYPTPDGSAVRDYIHVSDLAEAHVIALQQLQSGADSMFLNLGTGAGKSVLEIINVIEQISGRSISVNIQGRRAGDPAELVASTDLARKVLGWQPQYSDLESIIQTALQWHQGPGFSE